MQELAQNLGAVVSLALGVMAIVRPGFVGRFVSLKAVGRQGVSEIRATYGGFFAGIALFALVSQSAMVFAALGLGWLSAAIIRAITLLFGYASSKNVAAVGFEAVIAALCLAGLSLP